MARHTDDFAACCVDHDVDVPWRGDEKDRDEMERIERVLEGWNLVYCDTPYIPVCHRGVKYVLFAQVTGPQGEIFGFFAPFHLVDSRGQFDDEKYPRYIRVGDLHPDATWTLFKKTSPEHERGILQITLPRTLATLAMIDD